MVAALILAILLATSGGQNVRNLCAESEQGYYECQWNGVGRYKLPTEAKIVKFRRFFRPATMEITANLTTLILDTTNYRCSNFAKVEEKIFNSIICVSIFRARCYNYIRFCNKPLERLIL